MLEITKMEQNSKDRILIPLVKINHSKLRENDKANINEKMK